MILFQEETALAEGRRGPVLRFAIVATLEPAQRLSEIDCAELLAGSHHLKAPARVLVHSWSADGTCCKALEFSSRAPD